MVNEDEKGVSRSRRVVRPLSLTVSSDPLMEVTRHREVNHIPLRCPLSMILVIVKIEMHALKLMLDAFHAHSHLLLPMAAAPTVL